MFSASYAPSAGRKVMPLPVVLGATGQASLSISDAGALRGVPHATPLTRNVAGTFGLLDRGVGDAHVRRPCARTSLASAYRQAILVKW